MTAQPVLLKVSAINSYYDKAHILHDLSLAIGAGEVVALLGRNGAGKSTTLRSIMQLVRPQSGSVTFLGQELTRLRPYQVARLGIGYVPEDRRIFTDLTIRENLQVGRRPPRGDLPAGDSERQSGTIPEWTEERLYELFPNLAERRDNRGRELSGGEQQMLSIARTLMGNPQLLLLDEPSEGIAPVIVEQLAATIQQLKSAGLPVLLSEQNLHFARLVAERAIVIEGGTRRFDGALAELDAQPQVRDAYLSV